MSAINQMLRDLDARCTPPSQARIAPVLPRADNPGGSETSRSRVLSWAVLFAGAALTAGYALWQTRDAPPATIAVSAVPSATIAVSAARVPVIPTALPAPAPPPLLAAAPLPPVAVRPPLPAVKPVVLAPSPEIAPAETADRLKLAIVPPSPTVPSASPSARSEVTKNPVEPSASAIAQQLQDDGDALRHVGKVDAASRKYREALERQPRLSGARIALAQIMIEQGEAGAGLELLGTGYEALQQPDVAVTLGRLLATRGAPRADALKWLARGADALRPADHALTAALLAQEHRYDEAIRAYQRALTDEPHNGGWLLGMGLALEAADRHDEARTAYRQALTWGSFKPEVVKFLNERNTGPP